MTSFSHIKYVVKEKYSNDDLDFLALGMTAVKVFYCLGHLTFLPNLYQLIEPTRLKSLELIHLTDIRNEQAYYQCIGQTLAVRLTVSPYKELGIFSAYEDMISPKSSLLIEAKANPIFICGDSHTISPAWNIVSNSGVSHLLVPKLVTGIKHWHLRNECRFYPKANFFHALKTIPDESQVLIDSARSCC
jgi:hypothetical protein